MLRRQHKELIYINEGEPPAQHRAEQQTKRWRNCQPKLSSSGQDGRTRQSKLQQRHPQAPAVYSPSACEESSSCARAWLVGKLASLHEAAAQLVSNKVLPVLPEMLQQASLVCFVLVGLCEDWARARPPCRTHTTAALVR